MSVIASYSLWYSGVVCSMVGNTMSLPSYNMDDTGLMTAAVPAAKNSSI
jgi:hypothetical protein